MKDIDRTSSVLVKDMKLSKLQVFVILLGTTFSLLLFCHIFGYFGNAGYVLNTIMNSDTNKSYSVPLHQSYYASDRPNTFWDTTSITVNFVPPPPPGKGWWEGKRTLYLEGHRGRLGNHMFQYAAAYGIGKRTNSKIVMSSKHQLPQFFQNLTFPFNGDDKHTRSMRKISEIQPSYFSRKLFDEVPKVDKVHLCCYLESFRYFEGYESEIRSEFRFKSDIETKAREFIAKAQSAAEILYKTKNVTLVGIHIRRGDKAGKPGFGWVVPEKSYFVKAMKYMQEHYKNVYFIVTSEDYNWSKKNLGTEAIMYSSSGTSSGQDLAYLSKCDHVIMSVGTMGWWAGWLAGGDVIYFDKPTRHGTRADQICNLTDLFPSLPNWISLSN